MSKNILYVLIFMGIMVMMTWALFGGFFIRVSTYPIKEDTCQVIVNNYFPHSIQSYSLKYQESETIICTNFEGGECNLDSLNEQEISCFVYYSPITHIWYASLNPKEIQCMTSGLCAVKDMFFLIGVIFNFIYLFISLGVLIGVVMYRKDKEQIQKSMI